MKNKDSSSNTKNNLNGLLKQNGYSHKAIEELYKWYDSSEKE